MYVKIISRYLLIYDSFFFQRKEHHNLLEFSFISKRASSSLAHGACPMWFYFKQTLPTFLYCLLFRLTEMSLNITDNNQFTKLCRVKLYKPHSFLPNLVEGGKVFFVYACLFLWLTCNLNGYEVSFDSPSSQEYHRTFCARKIMGVILMHIFFFRCEIPSYFYHIEGHNEVIENKQRTIYNDLDIFNSDQKTI